MTTVLVICGLLCAVLGSPSEAGAAGSALRLDRATAYFATDFSEATNCGEGDDECRPLRCYRVTTTRVDCVVGYRRSGGPWQCTDIAIVALDGRRVFRGWYECKGSLEHIRKKALIRPEIKRTLRRFRTNIDWPIEDESNKYGVPRFDVNTDLYVPKGGSARASAVGRRNDSSMTVRLPICRREGA